MVVIIMTTQKIANSLEGRKLSAEISVYCDSELKQLAGKAADAAGVPLSEYVAQVLARELKRPDLGKIPRKRLGRPRKEVVIK